MAFKGPLGEDVHSYANWKQVRTTHIHLGLEVDFHRKIFYGHADLDLEAVADNVSVVKLDTRALAIEEVVDRKSNKPLFWTQPRHHESLGVELSIPLAAPVAKGTKIELRITYSTTINSAGIQWFEPEQTAGKKHPFCYTQCEAILARTLLPCQDAPAVKAPYSVKVTCPAPLVVACSGTPVGTPHEAHGKIIYEYKQVNPIPAYLIAIVCGALVKGQVGPRSSVWSEKELLEAAVYEFSQDTEKFIQTGEEITGLKYEWGVYDMVILPPAFPYGGMENPNLTFLSASLLAGDRSLTNVVAHEITHSWSGNYTTNNSWKDFWLNEGFTVYIERIILGKMHNSLAYRDFESLIGYYDLLKTVKDLEKHPEFTKLQPDLVDIDPDEAFSKIPYEKGSLFLRYLETKVGGLDKMLKWLKKYFYDYRFKSLSTEEMQQHFLHFFTHEEKTDKGILDSIEWEKFLKHPGLPNFDPATVYDKSLTEKCIALSKKWTEEGGKGTTPNDLADFQSKQKMYFLDTLIAHPTPLSHDLLKKLEETYKFSSAKNVEIVYRFLMLALASDFKEVFPQVAKFLATYGRGLYVRPLYKALKRVDHEFAKKVFHDNRGFYHSVIRHAVSDLLEIR